MPEHAPFNPEQFLAELEPVFQRPHDDADRLLHSPSIYERTGVLQTPLVTEDHLLRRLKSIYTGDGSGFAQDEAKAILDSPAAGDRLRGYALFAKKGPGFASNTSN
jgi:hypothetical protein